MTESTISALPERVGVVGGGRMGAGIAQVFAASGSTVIIAEATDQAAAVGRVRSGLQRAHERGKLDAPIDDVLARISTVAGPAELPADLDLAVEAVPELPKLKLEVLTQIEQTVRPTTTIATNTSSISIAELAVALRNPERFLGTHFFNPVPASTLVELIRGPHTTHTVVEVTRGWVRTLGKTDIVVNDSPGFATSRLGVCLGLEAIRMLEEGVADAESIDRAMELGYRHPMGPLRSTDLVGLDVRLAIAEHLAATLGERFTPPTLLVDMVARGQVGRKAGQGFYSWKDQN